MFHVLRAYGGRPFFDWSLSDRFTVERPIFFVIELAALIVNA